MAENAPESAGIVAQPVCVGARSWSAGALGDTVLYRSEQVGRKLEVGYFVYWSEERPWGQNFFSYTALPALAMDAVYSHFLYVFPGLKDALYGPGDVEGAMVEYEVRDDGSLAVLRGVADDASHRQVLLSRADLLDSKGRVVLLTDVWSHQLGSHGGGVFGDTRNKDLKCYRGSALQPMNERIARVFRLGSERDPHRGNPAWIDPVLPRQGVPAEQLATGKPAAVRQ
ncbi:MAG TPA: hypothetical protein VHV51_17335 [Polyangiaceae bacterium]|jgi:hypothetical protein|nr:hypothetical protein [Polyangiaceae bacterium]